MATRYQRGETAVLTTSTVNSAGAATTPATSFKITVTDPTGTKVVDAAAMTASATGVHYHNYAISVTAVLGEYRVEYVATNTGAVVTIERDYFTVIAQTTAIAAVCPVGLGELKEHLRVTNNNEDDYIAGLNLAATQHLEHLTGRKFLNQTVTRYFDNLTDGMELPWANLVSVTTVKYYDADNTQQTLAAAYYDADTVSEPGRLYEDPDYTFPAVTSDLANPVEIVYVAGYGTSPSNVPDGIKHAVKLLAAYWFENREAASTDALKDVPFAITALVAQYRTGKTY